MSVPQGRLFNKKAIITGAGQGLGEGIARKFVAEGARVLLFEIHPENGKRVAASLNDESVNGEVVVAVAFTGDATKGEDWQRAVDTCVKTFGGLDVVVNNAGVVHRAAVSENKSEESGRKGKEKRREDRPAFFHEYFTRSSRQKKKTTVDSIVSFFFFNPLSRSRSQDLLS
jgi:NAD(P)-dependent dehydrogenase (short-subunit alcohol dehydrogenase family)